MRSLMPATVEDVRLETKIVSNPELIRASVAQLVEEGVVFDDASVSWNPLHGVNLPFLPKAVDGEKTAPSITGDTKALAGSGLPFLATGRTGAIQSTGEEAAIGWQPGCRRPSPRSSRRP